MLPKSLGFKAFEHCPKCADLGENVLSGKTCTIANKFSENGNDICNFKKCYVNLVLCNVSRQAGFCEFRIQSFVNKFWNLFWKNVNIRLKVTMYNIHISKYVWVWALPKMCGFGGKLFCWKTQTIANNFWENAITINVTF